MSTTLRRIRSRLLSSAVSLTEWSMSSTEAKTEASGFFSCRDILSKNAERAADSCMMRSFASRSSRRRRRIM